MSKPELPYPDSGVGGDWQQSLFKNSKGQIERCVANVFDILTHDLRWKGVLAYDHKNQVVKHRAPPWEWEGVGIWERLDTCRLEIWFARNYRISPRRDMLEDAVDLVASLHRVEEIKP